MPLVAGVLLASLLGSVHCAAMCGAFTCLFATRTGREGRHAHVAYNSGRLISYVLLGTLAGAVGGRVDLAGQHAGIVNAAPIIAGVLMVVWGAGAFAAELGVKVPVTLAPEWAKRFLGRVLVASRERSATVRALVLGLVTTLLPCGWLYTFVVVAGGTGSPLRGAVVMVAFWAGTVPMLVTVGAGAARVLGPMARRLPLVSAGLVLSLGLLSIAGKLHPATAHATHDAAMHGGTAHVGR